MASRINERGFGIVEGVLVIAVIVIIGGVGWIAYNNFVAPKTSPADSSEMAGHDDMQMPKVEKPADLDKASAALDDESFENDGADELDKKAADF